jgi:hypothetical protein
MAVYVANSGTIISNVNLELGDTLQVQSGGIVSTITVSSGGSELISGGTAYSTAVNDGDLKRSFLDILSTPRLIAVVTFWLMAVSQIAVPSVGGDKSGFIIMPLSAVQL